MVGPPPLWKIPRKKLCFFLETFPKAGPHDGLSEPEFERWRGVLLDNIKKNQKFVPLLELMWIKASVTNRGI